MLHKFGEHNANETDLINQKKRSKHRILVSGRGTDDGEDIHENVDDVHVNVESGKDVLLRRNGVLVVATDHHLGIVNEVQ